MKHVLAAVAAAAIIGTAHAQNRTLSVVPQAPNVGNVQMNSGDTLTLFAPQPPPGQPPPGQPPGRTPQVVDPRPPKPVCTAPGAPGTLETEYFWYPEYGMWIGCTGRSGN